jgi:hypothetical protein
MPLFVFPHAQCRFQYKPEDADKFRYQIFATFGIPLIANDLSMHLASHSKELLGFRCTINPLRHLIALLGYVKINQDVTEPLQTTVRTFVSTQSNHTVKTEAHNYAISEAERNHINRWWLKVYMMISNAFHSVCQVPATAEANSLMSTRSQVYGWDTGGMNTPIETAEFHQIAAPQIPHNIDSEYRRVIDEMMDSARGEFEEIKRRLDDLHLDVLSMINNDDYFLQRPFKSECDRETTLNLLKALKLMGFSKFKSPEQATLVQAAMTRKSVFGIIETGGGKTGAMIMPTLEPLNPTGLTTVILCPFDHLVRGHYDTCIHIKGLENTAVWSLDNRVDVYRAPRVVICSADKGFMGVFVNWATQMGPKLARIVIDEAQQLSISKDFREIFKDAHRLRALNIPISFFSGSASLEVLSDLRKMFGLVEKAVVVRQNCLRKNVTLSARPIQPVPKLVGSSMESLSDAFLRQAGKVLVRYHSAIMQYPEQQLIVICRSKGDAEKIGKLLAVPCHHSEVPELRRAQIERDFKDGTLQTVVATTTLANGFHSPRTRTSFLVGLVYKMDDWIQVAGRVGRDNRDSYCQMLYPDPPQRQVKQGNSDFSGLDLLTNGLRDPSRCLCSIMTEYMDGTQLSCPAYAQNHAWCNRCVAMYSQYQDPNPLHMARGTPTMGEVAVHVEMSQGGYGGAKIPSQLPVSSQHATPSKHMEMLGASQFSQDLCQPPSEEPSPARQRNNNSQPSSQQRRQKDPVVLVQATPSVSSYPPDMDDIGIEYMDDLPPQHSSSPQKETRRVATQGNYASSPISQFSDNRHHPRSSIPDHARSPSPSGKASIPGTIVDPVIHPSFGIPIASPPQADKPSSSRKRPRPTDEGSSSSKKARTSPTTLNFRSYQRNQTHRDCRMSLYRCALALMTRICLRCYVIDGMVTHKHSTAFCDKHATPEGFDQLKASIREGGRGNESKTICWTCLGPYPMEFHIRNDSKCAFRDSTQKTITLDTTAIALADPTVKAKLVKKFGGPLPDETFNSLKSTAAVMLADATEFESFMSKCTLMHLVFLWIVEELHPIVTRFEEAR